MRSFSSAYDPGCVKTHTFASCRKNNSPARHRISRAQYDLTLTNAIALRYFYVWRKAWSFHTAKTHSGHPPDGNLAVQQLPAASSVLSFGGTGSWQTPPRFRTIPGLPQGLAGRPAAG